MGRVDIKNLFINLQAQLDMRLRCACECTDHPVAKGDASELCWSEMLEIYLPKRYSVEKKAFVIDSNGVCSDQIDIVIHDRQYSPFIFNKDDIKYIPAESIHAVFEAKPTLDKGNIEYAAGKLKSARCLERTTVPIKHAGGTHEPKRPPHILGGILTFDTGWTPPFGDSFREHIGEAAKAPESLIDFGCAVSCGAFDVTGADTGNLNIEISTKDDALIFFFIRLVARLQAMATVPALDIMAYAKWLDKSLKPAKWE